jgi:hypothetical protein
MRRQAISVFIWLLIGHKARCFGLHRGLNRACVWNRPVRRVNRPLHGNRPVPPCAGRIFPAGIFCIIDFSQKAKKILASRARGCLAVLRQQVSRRFWLFDSQVHDRTAPGGHVWIRRVFRSAVSRSGMQRHLRSVL